MQNFIWQYDAILGYVIISEANVDLTPISLLYYIVSLSNPNYFKSKISNCTQMISHGSKGNKFAVDWVEWRKIKKGKIWSGELVIYRSKKWLSQHASNARSAANCLKQTSLLLLVILISRSKLPPVTLLLCFGK